MVKNQGTGIKRLQIPLLVVTDHDKGEDDNEESKEDDPGNKNATGEAESSEKKEEKGKKMDIRTNASTDDLLSLESGAQSPEQNQNSLNANQENGTVAQNSEPVIPMPTQSARRKSAFPSDSLRLDLDETTWAEPQTAARPATKQRLRQNLQAKAAKVTAVVQRGKTPEFRFRVILIMLFASIISLVTFTWHMYNKHLHVNTFGDNIHFQDIDRTLQLLKKDELSSLLKVSLGKGIPSNLKSLNCKVLYHNKKENEIPNVCEEWKYRARLTIQYTHTGNFSCYNVKWKSLSKGTKLKDCVELSSAYWYGMGELSQNAWPLKGISIPAKPFVTGDVFKNEFGGILERYWLSSDGVAITVNPDVPLYVSLNDNGTEELCLEAKADGFPYRMSPNTNPVLDYMMCTGPDMKSLHEYMLLNNDKIPQNFTSKDFLEDTVWTSSYLEPVLNQNAIQSHANSIMEIGSLSKGFFLIDKRWQEEEGDLDFRYEMFPNASEVMVKILHSKGFRVLLTIQPYASLASKEFQNATDSDYFLSDADLDVPLLTRWNKKVCAIIDVTNNNSKQWLLSRLEQIQSEYNVDGFFVDGGQSMYLPRSYNYAESLVNPDKSISHLVDIVAEKTNFIGFNAGFMSQHAPAFISLARKTPTWDNVTGLQSIIPGVLTLGLLGYPLVNPGSVGGDLLHILKEGNDTKPEKELYIRWLQVTAFMPVVQVSIPPTDYDLDVIKMAKNLLTFRKSVIFPIMKKALDDYVNTGAPIIRPLWWLAPTDTNAQKVGDQFAVADTIVVAPILEKGKCSRDIYLPPGMWRDEILGQLRRGRKWIHNYSVQLDKIAYFTKQSG